MPPANPITVVFVHGWSVTHTNTYGQLPERLRLEARAAGLDLAIEEIVLGRYISFHDEVRVHDIARAFRAAVREQLADVTRGGGRFVCITHSTGGPVIRDWWHRYYASRPGSGTCPMSNLVMLAPANHGSALAQLGKSRVGRLKSWVGGVEPGQGVLDWLELGSAEAWDLNSAWIRGGGEHIGARGVFPFVITGQWIDRKLYDNLNTYTGELGSDGVVRVAAANLEGRYLHLEQQVPVLAKRQPSDPSRPRVYEAPALTLVEAFTSPATALRVVEGRSHSGKRIGIMRSVKVEVGRDQGAETVQAILECLAVRSRPQYAALCERFRDETAAVQRRERLEIDRNLFLSDAYFIRDRFCQVIFRVRDHEGLPVRDYDLLLTGKGGDVNLLPVGFYVDRQRNSRSPETITYYLDYDVMLGAPEVVDEEQERVVRAKGSPVEQLGLRLRPRPQEGFVRYLDCEISASRELLDSVIAPNSTTLVDITLHRVVGKHVFRLDLGSQPSSFKSEKPGDPLED